MWKLERCLYGLKQSAAQWHTMLSSTLQRMGFVQGVADPCYFSRSANGGFELRLCIHVDDICICSNDRDYLAAFSPPNAKGAIANEILYTAALCGITTIVKVGGIQAIAGLTFGTSSIPKVSKIFGPVFTP